MNRHNFLGRINFYLSGVEKKIQRNPNTNKMEICHSLDGKGQLSFPRVCGNMRTSKSGKNALLDQTVVRLLETFFQTRPCPEVPHCPWSALSKESCKVSLMRILTPLISDYL